MEANDQPTGEIPVLPLAKEMDVMLFNVKDELTDYEAKMNCSLLILEGRASEWGLDPDSGAKMDPNDEPLCELGPGDLINPDFFVSGQDRLSARRVVASSAGKARVITREGLDATTLRLLEGFAIRCLKDLSLSARAAIRTAGFDKEVERIKGETEEQRREATHWKIQSEAKEREIEALRGQARQLTRDVVNKALLRRNHELEAQNREQTTKLRARDQRIQELEASDAALKVANDSQDELVRTLRATNHENEKKLLIATATVSSMRKLVEACTDEVVEYDRLRDLPELETKDKNKFLSEVQRIFLSLYNVMNVKLQSLGIQGLGILSEPDEASNKPTLDDGKPITDEEIESGLSGTPSGKSAT